MDKYKDLGIFLKVHLSFFKSGLAAIFSGTGIKIFLCICTFMDENGECYPSISQIAELCGVPKRTVSRSIKEILAIRVAGKPI
ncbi:helix-turn-helix domain-containing protein [Robertmurraya sp. GLU-23]